MYNNSYTGKWDSECITKAVSLNGFPFIQLNKVTMRKGRYDMNNESSLVVCGSGVLGIEKDFGLSRDENGNILTTSLHVSRIYGKDHPDVLKKIRGFINIIPDLGLGNFSLSSYSNEQGKKQPMYIIDKVGFAMLVNKFTGEDATIFTYQYAKAFENMEKEIVELKQDVKDITIIALSADDQAKRLQELNNREFSERRTQKSFANCVDYDQYKDMYKRFLDHIKPMKAEDRVLKLTYAMKGMEKLRYSLLMMDMSNAGSCINIDNDIKQILKQIDKLNNKMLGGEKAYKTRTIYDLESHIDMLETKLSNSLVYPSSAEFTTLPTHGYSNNYMYSKDASGKTSKTQGYKDWLKFFPYRLMPTKASWEIDWTKPIEIFLDYVALEKVDISNLDKSAIDCIVTKVYGVDDNIVQYVHSRRSGICDRYQDGKISFFIRNIDKDNVVC